MKRRIFLEKMLTLGIVVHFPFTACELIEDEQQFAPFSASEFETLQSLCAVLSPSKNVSGKAAWYVLWGMHDSETYQEGNVFLVDELKRFHEKVKTRCDLVFSKLAETNKLKIVVDCQKDQFYFLERLLVLTLEAELIHPVYGFNDGRLAEQLEVIYGNPEPDELTKYPTIFKSIAQS